MARKIRGNGTAARREAGAIHPALPKLCDQLQSRGRHGAPLHRETQRHRSGETVERIRETPFLATLAQWIAVISKEQRKSELATGRVHPTGGPDWQYQNQVQRQAAS